MTQPRNKRGQFGLKGEEKRKIRSVRLTDDDWDKLGKVADNYNISRSDLIVKLLDQEPDEKIEGERKKENKTVQLSDSIWNRLREIAEQQGISQADVIKNLMNQNNKDVDEAIKILKQVMTSKGKVIPVMKSQVKKAISYLDGTQNLNRT